MTTKRAKRPNSHRALRLMKTLAIAGGVVVAVVGLVIVGGVVFLDSVSNDRDEKRTAEFLHDKVSMAGLEDVVQIEVRPEEGGFTHQIEGKVQLKGLSDQQILEVFSLIVDSEDVLWGINDEHGRYDAPDVNEVETLVLVHQLRQEFPSGQLVPQYAANADPEGIYVDVAGSARLATEVAQQIAGSGTELRGIGWARDGSGSLREQHFYTSVTSVNDTSALERTLKSAYTDEVRIDTIGWHDGLRCVTAIVTDDSEQEAQHWISSKQQVLADDRVELSPDRTPCGSNNADHQFRMVHADGSYSELPLAQ